MSNEMSYDTGVNPFIHDNTREKWSRPTDFLFACIGHAFKIDSIAVVTSFFIIGTGIYGVFVYFLMMTICVMPIILLQSFLGQFSSTGFISAFRIVPLFKGIGFVALALNIVTLTYYSIFSAVPLFFFFNTLRSTIPWSCEGIKSWMMETGEYVTTPCEEHNNRTRSVMMNIPSIEFLKYHINTFEHKHDSNLEGHFSWPLLVCAAVIWILVGIVLTRKIDMISKILRYSCIAVCSIIGLFVLRFAFLPGAFNDFPLMLDPHPIYIIHVIYAAPLVAVATLGPGWGSTLTMASFNKFKTNILNFSWIICLAHFGIVVGLAMIPMFSVGFLRRDDPRNTHFQRVDSMWVELLMVPSVLTLIGFTRILTLLFLSMMILGSMNLIVVQLLSVLTSLFDEYPRLRTHKTKVTVGLTGFMALITIYSCSNHGIHFFTLLSQFSFVTQMLLNLLLVLVVLWIYGWQKFQRDLEFMTERTYPTWMVNVVAYFAPLSLILVVLLGLSEKKRDSLAKNFAMLITFGPWLLIPAYCGFKILRKMSIQRGLRPADWYPVDPENKQRYDQLFNKTETAHQLTTNME